MPPISRLTNEEFVMQVMRFSKYGALAQAFVISAMEDYAKRVIETPPEKQEFHTLINYDAWVGVAKEIQTKLEKQYELPERKQV